MSCSRGILSGGQTSNLEDSSRGQCAILSKIVPALVTDVVAQVVPGFVALAMTSKADKTFVDTSIATVITSVAVADAKAVIAKDAARDAVVTAGVASSASSSAVISANASLVTAGMAKTAVDTLSGEVSKLKIFVKTFVSLYTVGSTTVQPMVVFNTTDIVYPIGETASARQDVGFSIKLLDGLWAYQAFLVSDALKLRLRHRIFAPDPVTGVATQYGATVYLIPHAHQILNIESGKYAIVDVFNESDSVAVTITLAQLSARLVGLAEVGGT